MIRAGIANNEFMLYYQPKIYINTLKFAGVEALLRWKVTADTIIDPDSFIPFIEKNDLLWTIIKNNELLARGECKYD